MHAIQGKANGFGLGFFLFESLNFKSLNTKSLNHTMNNKKLKSIVLSMVLVAGMLLPASSFAQSVEAETGGGLLGLGKLFGTDDPCDNLIGEELTEAWMLESGGLFGTGDLFDNLIGEEPTEAWTPENGGLFNSYESDNADNTFLGNSGFFNSGLFGKGGAINDDITGGITNGSFGEEVPLGGGIAIMLVAGLGYVAFKKKEDEQ